MCPIYRCHGPGCSHRSENPGYVGLGIGELVGLITFGILSDRILKAKMVADNVQEPKPEYRLVLMMVGPDDVFPASHWTWLVHLLFDNSHAVNVQGIYR
jgi:hypothetical protein